MWAVERHVEKGAKLVVRRQELWLLSPHGVAPEVAGPKALAVKCPFSGALFFFSPVVWVLAVSFSFEDFVPKFRGCRPGEEAL